MSEGDGIFQDGGQDPFEDDPVFVHGADDAFDDGPIVVPGMPRPPRARRERRRPAPSSSHRARRPRRSRVRSEGYAPQPAHSARALRRALVIAFGVVVACAAVGILLAVVRGVADRAGGGRAFESGSYEADADYSWTDDLDVDIEDDFSWLEDEAGGYIATCDIPVEVDAGEDYALNAGSRIPVRVTGTDDAGGAIDEVMYVDAYGYGLYLPYGEYELSVAGSPITFEGVIYEVPEKTVSITVDDDYPDLLVKIELDEVPADEMTDEQIEDAYAFAVDGGCYSEETADWLRDCAYRRRDEAVEPA